MVRFIVVVLACLAGSAAIYFGFRAAGVYVVCEPKGWLCIAYNLSWAGLAALILIGTSRS